MHNVRRLFLAALWLSVVAASTTRAQTTSTDSGDYDLEVVRVNAVDSWRVLAIRDMTLFNPAKQLAENMTQKKFQNEPQQFGNGQAGGFAGGGGASGGSTASGGFGGAGRRSRSKNPNLQIEVMVSPKSRGKKAKKLVMFHSEYELLDDLGNTYEGTDNSGTYQAPGFENAYRPGSRFLYVHLPDENATQIKSLKGGLIVSEGIAYQAYVQEDEMQKKVRKKSGEHFVEFEPLKKDGDSYSLTVHVSVIPLSLDEPDRNNPMQMGRGGFNMRDMQKQMQKRMQQESEAFNERMKKEMEANFNTTVIVLAKGDDGRIYQSNSAHRSMQGSDGGSSGGGFSSSFGQIPQQQRQQRNRPNRRNINAPKKETRTFSVGFDYFPADVRPQAIKCIVIQRTGDLERHTFELKDVPVQLQN